MLGFTSGKMSLVTEVTYRCNFNRFGFRRFRGERPDKLISQFRWQCKGPKEAGHSEQRRGGWQASVCQVSGPTTKPWLLRQAGAAAHR